MSSEVGTAIGCARRYLVLEPRHGICPKSSHPPWDPARCPPGCPLGCILGVPGGGPGGFPWPYPWGYSPGYSVGTPAGLYLSLPFLEFKELAELLLHLRLGHAKRECTDR